MTPISRLAAGHLTMPRSVSLKSNGVLWAAAGADFRRGRPPRVESFIQLADAPDSAILAFAKRYGILGLCSRHNLPEAHNQFAGRATVEYTPGDFLPCQPSMREPLTEWRLWARRFQACLDVAAALDSDKPVNRDSFELLWEVRLPRGLIRHPHAKHTLQATLNAYLLLGGCRPRVEIDKGIRLTFTPGGMFNLFGFLALDLVTTIARTEGLAMCSSCGLSYVVTGRKPAASRRNYCPACREDKAPQRDASRDARRRKREARKKS